MIQHVIQYDALPQGDGRRNYPKYRHVLKALSVPFVALIFLLAILIPIWLISIPSVSNLSSALGLAYPWAPPQEDTVPLSTEYMCLFLHNKHDPCSSLKRIVLNRLQPNADKQWVPRALIYTVLEDENTYGENHPNRTILTWLTTIQNQLNQEIREARNATNGWKALLDYHLSIMIPSSEDLEALMTCVKAASRFGRVTLLQLPPPPPGAKSLWMWESVLREDDDLRVPYAYKSQERNMAGHLLSTAVLSAWNRDPVALYVDLGADRFDGIFSALRQLDEIVEPARQKFEAYPKGPYVAARLGDMQLLDEHDAQNVAATGPQPNPHGPSPILGWGNPILCFGDSITEYGGGQGGWVSLLASAQTRMRDVFNRGIHSSGTSVYTMGKMVQMSRGLVPLGRSPHLVTLFWGQNDFVKAEIGVPLPLYEAQLRVMIYAVRKMWPSTRVLVITPHLRSDLDLDSTQRLLAFRAGATRAAKSFSNIDVLDTWTIFLGPEWLKPNDDEHYAYDASMMSPVNGDKLNPEIITKRLPAWLKTMKELTYDNIHYGYKGHEMLFKAVNQYLTTISSI
ncbi:hypothetical protein CXG81DRAFT_18792 [Caulochytrium protostelioides]|uniref:SGNH hydrolase n=1 Tax=Caulochytrium protostelioides TaxID=1555241 RepID=A0A4P9WUS2_9FUNG|nr:SGNH hydrolase [Caulochytrium protostelioides]RKP01370.1 hypothetical protein CXG81DRAFT_18792 [Caulochytrium protostelioides]|eukprot:RKP01370.1 hypothetical protein CXG81DRAFT_18792 [Caulochytrium protostelioides]